MIKSIKYGNLKQYFTSIHRFYRLSLNIMPQNPNPNTFQSVLKQDNNASKADRSEDGFDNLWREEEKPSSKGKSGRSAAFRREAGGKEKQPGSIRISQRTFRYPLRNFPLFFTPTIYNIIIKLSQRYFYLYLPTNAIYCTPQSMIT